MSATLLNLRDQIKFKRPEIQGNPSFVDAVLTQYINEGQRYVQTQLVNLGVKQWEASDSLTLSAGTFAEQIVKTANLATDCPNRLFDDKNAIKFIMCSTAGDSSNLGQAKYIDDNKFLELIRNSYLTPTMKQPAFTRMSNMLYISPSTVDTATAHYYKALADLTTDTSTAGVPIAFEEFIVKRALIGVDEQLKKLNDKEEKISQLSKDIASTFQSLNAGISMDKTETVLQ